MKYEGKGMQKVKIKGVFYDVVHYAILIIENLLINLEKSIKVLMKIISLLGNV